MYGASHERGFGVLGKRADLLRDKNRYNPAFSTPPKGQTHAQTLHRLRPARRHGYVRSSSAFSWKAEALLTLAGLPFEREYVANISQMPKGKIPVLEDKGRLIPDSSHIRQYLADTYGFDLDSHLTAEQKAVGTAFQRLAEEHLHWVNNYAFFIDPAGKDWVMKAILDGLPQDEAEGFYQFLFDKLTGQLHAQGLGRHSREEIYAFGREDVDAVAAFLGDKPFLFGDKISSFDTAVAPSFPCCCAPKSTPRSPNTPAACPTSPPTRNASTKPYSAAQNKPQAAAKQRQRPSENCAYWFSDGLYGRTP